MIKSSLMLCAEGIIRDAETNNISVFKIFENIIPEGLPLFFPRFMVLVFLDREDKDPSEIKCTLRIKLNQENLVEKVVSISFQNKKRNRIIANIGGLPIEKQGTLETSLWLGDKMLNKYKVVINEPRKTTVETKQG